MSVAVIIAAAGRGARMGRPTPKQLLTVGGKSLLTRSIEAFARVPRVEEIVVVVPGDLVDTVSAHVPAVGPVRLRVVPGGPRRQDSVALGFRALSPEATVVLVHDAARAFVTSEIIDRTIDAAARHGAATAAIAARDTVKQARRAGAGLVVAATLRREEIFLAQTPQGFARDVLGAAVALGDTGVEATDEARLAELAGFEVALVEGDPRNLKVTTAEDLQLAAALSAFDEPPARGANGRPASHGEGSGRSTGGMDVGPGSRVGVGYDSHRLVDGRPLVLGGVRVPFGKGLAGHSDADAVAHAVTDAVLGAAALGDIGALFPDTDPRWKDADSMGLLAQAVTRVGDAGFRVVNVDVTVIAERPKLGPYREEMRSNLARALGVDVGAVSVKGKTNEGMDATGRGEAIAVHAVALLALGR